MTNTAWRWIDRQLLVLLHDESLAMHGGASGLRDAGLLESALSRPLNLAAYGNPDLTALAAGYASGLAQNHPFVDGNKRTGLNACLVFLDINGWLVSDPDMRLYDAMIGMATRSIGKRELSVLRDPSAKAGRRRRRQVTGSMTRR